MSEDQVLRIERLIAASPERVFELWTEPELLVAWWGPEGFDVPTHAIDVRPGGRWRTTMRSPEGKLVTVSGVYRTIDKPHPLQRAFNTEHALQCGYCTPGMIMAAADLLRTNPHPSDEEIRDGLEGNLCRCTGYENIVRAIRRAAEAGVTP